VFFSNLSNYFGSGMHVETIEIDDEFKCGPTKYTIGVLGY
jgi:hypothetical protein